MLTANVDKTVSKTRTEKKTRCFFIWIAVSEFGDKIFMTLKLIYRQSTEIKLKQIIYSIHFVMF